MNFRACVNDRVWGELRRTIPKDDRYYLQTNYGLVHFWTFTSLLPRIAVDDPRKADWIVSYRAEPGGARRPARAGADDPARVHERRVLDPRCQGEEVIRSVVGLLAANAAFFAAGAGLVRLFGWRLRTHPGLAYMAGIASVGVLSTLMLMAGLALRCWQALILCALLASPRARPARAAATRGRDAKIDWRLARPFGRAARRLPRRPLRPVPVPGAELLGRVGEMDDEGARDRPPRRTRHVRVRQPRLSAARARLPDADPGLEAIDFRFMGRLDNLVIHVQFWLLLVGFLVAAYELLRDRVPQTPALAVAAARRNRARARRQPHLGLRRCARRVLLLARRDRGLAIRRHGRAALALVLRGSSPARPWRRSPRARPSSSACSSCS